MEKEKEEEERKVHHERHLGIFVHASDPTHSGRIVIPCSTVLMTVPFFHCVAPGLLALSPYWDLLKDLHATVQATRAAPQQLEVGNDATMVTTAVALHLADCRSPLHRYLREVCDPPRGVLPAFPPPCSSDGNALQSQRGVWQDSRTMVKLQRELPPVYQEPFGRLRGLMSQYLSALHQALVERHTSLGSRFPCPCLQDLHLAHALCESRCLQVPSSPPSSVDRDHQQQQQYGDERDAEKATSSTMDDVFQGPTLVPGIDLLNHASLHEEPNVAVALVPVQELVEEMAVPRELLLAQGTTCPLYVVALATRDLRAGEELRYHYVDPADDDDAQNALFWALRFHFLPDHLRTT